MGPGHCGSTLLDLILGSHSNAFSLGEFHRLHRCLDEANTGELQICGVCTEGCDFWNRKVSIPVLRNYYSGKSTLRRLIRKFANLVSNPYKKLMAWSGKSIMVDSSKQPGWIARQLKPAHKWKSVTPYLVYLQRDGRAVVSSYFRKYPERGIKVIAEDWCQQVEEMDRYYEEFPGAKLRMTYEELATEPEKTIRVLCEQFDIPYEAEMLRYWAHDHHHIFGNGGTRNLIWRYREQFDTHSESTRQRIEDSKQHYAHEYYDEIDVAIKLDERWRREMTEEDLQAFNAVAGATNAAYAWPDRA
jgi:hypothetical protein